MFKIDKKQDKTTIYHAPMKLTFIFFFLISFDSLAMITSSINFSDFLLYLIPSILFSFFIHCSKIEIDKEKRIITIVNIGFFSYKKEIKELDNSFFTITYGKSNHKHGGTIVLNNQTRLFSPDIGKRKTKNIGKILNLLKQIKK